MTIVALLGITCVRLRRFPKRLADFVIVAKSFSGDPGHRSDLSVGNSMDEVVAVSEGIQERGIDERTLEMLTLSVEKMAGNIVQYAFKP